MTVETGCTGGMPPRGPGAARKALGVLTGANREIENIKAQGEQALLVTEAAGKQQRKSIKTAGKQERKTVKTAGKVASAASAQASAQSIDEAKVAGSLARSAGRQEHKLGQEAASAAHARDTATGASRVQNAIDLVAGLQNVGGLTDTGTVAYTPEGGLTLVKTANRRTPAAAKKPAATPAPTTP